MFEDFKIILFTGVVVILLFVTCSYFGVQQQYNRNKFVLDSIKIVNKIEDVKYDPK